MTPNITRGLQGGHFIATRTDGLGGRLLALVNAMVLARAYDGTFRFTWHTGESKDRGFHLIDPVDRVFSQRFIDKYWIGPSVEPEGIVALDPAIEDQIDGRQGPLQWSTNSFRLMAAFAALTDDPRGSRAFAEIEFSDPVQAAFAAALQVALPAETAGLHLRSGDIVHGPYRGYRNFHDKVIPSPLAPALIEMFGREGRSVLVFGQHEPTLRQLADRTGCLLAQQAFTGDEAYRAYFEMALMSRCDPICAGSSIFAQVAAVMGDKAAKAVHEVMPKTTQAQAILSELSRPDANYHPLEAAYGYQWMCFRASRALTNAQQIGIIEAAWRLDPENRLYPVMMATRLFEAKRFEEGEAHLKAAMDADERPDARWPSDTLRIMMARTEKGKGMMAEQHRTLIEAGSRGLPYAAALAAFALHERGLGEQAKQLIGLALHRDSTNPMFLKIKRRVDGVAPFKYVKPVVPKKRKPKSLWFRIKRRLGRMLGW